jgi:hypothetical protein
MIAYMCYVSMIVYMCYVSMCYDSVHSRAMPDTRLYDSIQVLCASEYGAGFGAHPRHSAVSSHITSACTCRVEYRPELLYFSLFLSLSPPLSLSPSKSV